MSRRPAGAAAFVALALAAGAASGAETALPPTPYRGRSGTLPSGMRVATYELPGVVLFSLAASYRAGSADDPRGKEGLAALAARVVARRGGGGGERLSHAQRLLAAGVRFASNVDRDGTVFLASGPPDRLPAVLAVEAERLRDPLRGVTAEDFVRERDLYAEELAEQRLALPEQAGSAWLLEAALGGSSYARPVAGTPESVRALTLDDARAWARQRFTPAHLVLAITTPAAGAWGQTFSAFGSLATGEAGEVPGWARATRPADLASFPVITPEPAATQSLRVRHEPVGSAQLWLGWLLPGQASVDGPRAVAAAALALDLGESAASAEHRGSLRTLIGAHGFTLAAVRVNVDREEDALKVLRGLRRKRAPGERISEFVAAYGRKALLLAAYLQAEQPDVSFLATQVRLLTEPDPLAAWRQKVSTALSSGFEDWVERWLDPGRVVAVLVVPEKGREEPSELKLPDTARRWATTMPEEPRLPPGRYDVDDLARPPGLEAVQRRRLGNGLEVVVFRRKGFPRVEGRLVVRTRPGGTSEVPAALPAMALSSARAPSGLFRPVGCPFAAADFRGDRVVAKADGPSNRLDEVIHRLACWADEPDVEGSAMKWARALFELAVGRTTPELAVSRAAVSAAFPGWAGGWWDQASLEAITTAQAGEWLETELRPDRATLILAGDLDVGPKLFEAVEDAFGKWRVRKRAPAAPPGPPPGTPSRSSPVLLGHRQGAKTALISLWLRGPVMGERDLAAERAWLAELARLLERRRAMGLLKDVEVFELEPGSGSSLILLTTSSRTEEATETLRRMLEAVGGTAITPVGEGVLGLLRWGLAIDFPFGFATVGDVANQLAELAAHGHPDDFWERYPDSLATLDGKRIQAVARNFSVGREVVGIVGDREVLEPQLRGAGFRVERVETPAAAAEK